MALIGNNHDTLLKGLSDFWVRFFKDSEELQSAYEGVSFLVGQVYLELLHSVLNSSVEDAPVFKKENFRLLTVREDEVFYREGLSLNSGRYGVHTEMYYHSLPFLQNKVFEPTASLEEVEDYDILNGKLFFLEDPVHLPGYATRTLHVETGGVFRIPGKDWAAQGVKKGDQLIASASDPTLRHNTSTFTIVYVAGDQLFLSRDTPVVVDPQDSPPHAWAIRRFRVDRTSFRLPGAASPAFEGYLSGPEILSDIKEISFWAVSGGVDSYALYENFGHLFTTRRASSETYRALLKGLMQLYIMGPAIDRIESALHVLTNLPVIRDDGEVLDSYSSGLDGSGLDGSLSDNRFHSPSGGFTPTDVGGHILVQESQYATNIGNHQIIAVESEQVVWLRPPAHGFKNDTSLSWEFSRSNAQIVNTDQRSYAFPRQVPLRADVTDPANEGQLSFQAFEPLTTAVRVVDYLKDPEWWHYISIPSHIAPGRTLRDRFVSPQLYPWVLGPEGRFSIGDPGLQIGGDTYRNHANFEYLDRYLKYHLFSVEIAPEIPLSHILLTDIQNLMREVKPAHTEIYLRPLSTFTDRVRVQDVLSTVKPFARFRNSFEAINNELRIGQAVEWRIGDRWVFSGYDVQRSGTGNALAIGGTNPFIYRTEGKEGGLFVDRTLSALVRSEGDEGIHFTLNVPFFFS